MDKHTAKRVFGNCLLLCRRTCFYPYSSYYYCYLLQLISTFNTWHPIVVIVKHHFSLCPFCSHRYSSSSSSSFNLQLLSAGRRGSAGFAPQPAADHRRPAALHLLHRRPQYPLCQFLPPSGPRRLPVEPGGRRGRVGLLRHLRPRGPAVEPSWVAESAVKGQGSGKGGEEMG